MPIHPRSPRGNQLYVGDFNLSRSIADNCTSLTAPGVNAAIDPINSPGEWLDTATFKSIHTQSPSDSSLSTGFNGTAGGGVDRFGF